MRILILHLQVDLSGSGWAALMGGIQGSHTMERLKSVLLSYINISLLSSTLEACNADYSFYVSICLTGSGIAQAPR